MENTKTGIPPRPTVTGKIIAEAALMAAEQMQGFRPRRGSSLTPEGLASILAFAYQKAKDKNAYQIAAFLQDHLNWPLEAARGNNAKALEHSARAVKILDDARSFLRDEREYGDGAND